MGQKESQRPKIAVIGAGFAGLRCADVLLRSGLDVTVFEARNRIGGRVYQVSVGGQLLDVGANWIHEPNENPILKIAEATRTVLLPRPEGAALVDSSGQPRPTAYALKLKTVMEEVFSQASEYSCKHSAEIDPGRSIMDFVRGQVSDKFKDQPELVRDLLCEAERRGMWDGDPVSRLSLRHQCLEEGPGGTDLFVCGTYKDIAARVAKIVVARNAIRLGHQVKRITYGTPPRATKVTVETADGAKDSFDEVVVTCPLGWLKQHKDSVFTPALPSPLSQAIDNIRQKIYLTFPSAFWLSHSDDRRNPSVDTYPFATHFHHPSYVKAQLAYPANQMIISLAHLPDGQSHPTLLFYIHGPYATQLVQSVKGLEPHGPAYNKVIESLTHPFYSRLPNYSPDNSACKPVSYYCSTWQLDDLAGNGAYSTFQIGQADAAKDVAAIRDAGPLSQKQGIWFAGEHIAPACRQATTVGAYISGERVAERICEKWKLSIVKEGDD